MREGNGTGGTSSPTAASPGVSPVGSPALAREVAAKSGSIDLTKGGLTATRQHITENVLEASSSSPPSSGARNRAVQLTAAPFPLRDERAMPAFMNPGLVDDAGAGPALTAHDDTDNHPSERASLQNHQNGAVLRFPRNSYFSPSSSPPSSAGADGDTRAAPISGGGTDPRTEPGARPRSAPGGERARGRTALLTQTRAINKAVSTRSVEKKNPQKNTKKTPPSFPPVPPFCCCSRVALSLSLNHRPLLRHTRASPLLI